MYIGFTGVSNNFNMNPISTNGPDMPTLREQKLYPNQLILKTGGDPNERFWNELTRRLENHFHEQDVEDKGGL